MPEAMNLKLAAGIVTICLLSLLLNSYTVVPESRLLFSINSQSRIRLGVINTSKQTLNLSITNKAGDVFLQQTTKTGSNYFQLFDISKLPDGEYMVILTGLNDDIVRKFFIANGKAELKSIVVPQFAVSGESLRVYFSNPLGKPVTISIEQNNELVFTDKEINDIVVNKKYSLKQMMKGSYTVKLSVDDESFNYSFEVK